MADTPALRAGRVLAEGMRRDSRAMKLNADDEVGRAFPDAAYSWIVSIC